MPDSDITAIPKGDSNSKPADQCQDAKFDISQVFSDLDKLKVFSKTEHAAAAMLPALQVFEGHPCTTNSGSPASDQTAPAITKPGEYHEHLTIAGRDRTYSVHVPKAADGKVPANMPVVIMLHGWGESGDKIEQMTKMNQEADQKGFIAIYPDAIDNYRFDKFGGKAWDSGNGLKLPGSADPHDVDFISTIIDTTKAQLSVDNKRVYVAGFSNGGMMAYDLASKLPGQIAAVAAVSSGMDVPSTPTNTNSVSVLSIHGTADKLIPIDGANAPSSGNAPGSSISNRLRTVARDALGVPEFSSSDATSAYWAHVDGISNPPVISAVNSMVQKTDYQGGKNGTEVVQYTVTGGTHDWYGNGDTPNTTADDSIDATEEIWNFFASHPKT